MTHPDEWRTTHAEGWRMTHADVSHLTNEEQPDRRRDCSHFQSSSTFRRKVLEDVAPCDNALTAGTPIARQLRAVLKPALL